MVAATTTTTTMRSIIGPSTVVILLINLCMQPCVSFQISQSSREATIISSRLQHKSSHHIFPPIAAIHRHQCRPPPSQLLLATNSDGKDCGNSSDSKNTGNSEGNGTNTIEPLLLQPYLPAMDPNYSTQGPIGLDKFILSREGPPTIEELSNEQMLRIVKLECSDLEVNTLVWKCLGYRFNNEAKSWSNVECFPKWREQYPTPPDLIGMKRVYSREIDSASLRSNQALVRSIPVDNKQSLKTHLKPLGWKGYQVNMIRLGSLCMLCVLFRQCNNACILTRYYIAWMIPTLYSPIDTHNVSNPQLCYQ